MMKQTLILAFVLLTCGTKAQERRFLDATFTSCSIVIDGHDNEPCWEETSWLNIDQVWLGEHPSENDFSGKFKVLWDSGYLYLLAEITDDVLHDEYADPLKNWWKDDCLEIFVDEDNSGGDHKHNYNAFAYHINIFHDVVDLGKDGEPHLYNKYVCAEHTSDGNLCTWEVRFPLYTDAFSLESTVNPTRLLMQGDTIGLSVAYCDNDGGPDRESFIGSEEIEGPDKNTSYKNASVFGAVVLNSNVVNNITSPKFDVDINVYNNQIIIESGNAIKQVKIYQLNGCLIYHKKNPGNSINISQLDSGFYILHLIDDNINMSYKFVKE